MKTRQANMVHFDVEYISFEVRDNKGRDIGARINRYETDYIEDNTLECYYRVLPGHYYGFYFHATRDKIGYGASQTMRQFVTPEEREQAIDKYIASAKKRAQKKVRP